MVDFHEDFLEKITAIHFPTDNFYVQISATLTNITNRNDNTLAPEPGYPSLTVAINPKSGAKLVGQTTSRSRSASDSSYKLLYLNHGFYIPFDVITVPGVCGDGADIQVGWDSFDDLVSTYGLNNLNNAVNNGFFGAGTTTPGGWGGGPVAKFQVNYSLPGDGAINWSGASTLLDGSGLPTQLTVPMANAAGDFLLAVPHSTCTDGGGNTFKHFFVGTYSVGTVVYASQRENSISYTGLFKVRNKKDLDALTVNISGLVATTGTINNGSRTQGGVTVQFYTTDFSGNKNIPSKPPITLANIGTLFADAVTNAATASGGVTQLNGTFPFKFWRVKAVPMWTGAHIGAVAPFPSV